ncbi:Alpha-acetolactate decarboxylase (AlsD) (PDB:1XV2) [Commensalibacter communis]|uniref:Alpha-acetolactate decarboxylase n=1 Tax=Commensalibacter communis TaxID=2972786 RepID=A0A9W4TQ05_9PROT|nr:acetolactate decarboxylase [Commensalibacter communis]CAI3924250.1 Alpha-acetolactate decarboxylase (AlsD) (PDB:1XV2) [Commensalibacter communis]CAI3924776.1 Alpha-acetolactate decarboxylase (AlsD) (PDB:1XV2) [Commensalibacter communis]CAI3945879.1 Alpha-acetolactate decarboxylase (AlsD) (PDB:1XV2) [Commensalibacter communis]CAI3946491.1 Alpha-acetolactate decarboxylase (AlsD) (PDB:1XV2) [Commensalibacter communis]
MKKHIHQFSGINSLMAGVFEGLFPISEIKKHGDFGLGCSDGLAGEVIIDCCHFYEAKSDTPLRDMSDQEHMPFAQITTFNPDKIVNFTDINKSNLYNELAKYTLLDNVFVAVKIEGIFDKMQIRRPKNHNKAYKTALEVSQDQVVDHFENKEGSLIGFWTPEFFQNISVAGFHLHFINTEKTLGGHMMDFSISQGTLSYEVKQSLDIKLSDKESYLKQDLKIKDMDQIIKQVEN